LDQKEDQERPEKTKSWGKKRDDLRRFKSQLVSIQITTKISRQAQAQAEKCQGGVEQSNTDIMEAGSTTQRPKEIREIQGGKIALNTPEGGKKKKKQTNTILKTHQVNPNYFQRRRSCTIRDSSDKREEKKQRCRRGRAWDQKATKKNLSAHVLVIALPYQTTSRNRSRGRRKAGVSVSGERTI